MAEDNSGEHPHLESGMRRVKFKRQKSTSVCVLSFGARIPRRNQGVGPDVKHFISVAVFHKMRLYESPASRQACIRHIFEAPHQAY